MKRRDQMIVLLAVTGLLVVCINLVVFNALARLKLFSAPKGFPSAELRPVGTEPIRIDSLTKCSYIRYCTEAVAGSVCSTAKLLLTCSLVLSLRISAASR